MFPLADPIPLPAPVWLFKVLSLATLALHFMAVYLLVGGLAFAAAWAAFGRQSKSPAMLDAAGAVTNRLPVVMTYVINLGVPPLLFAQVLYGRAIYTSSVLIGVYWIAVVFLLMACYTLLYVMTSASKKGRSYGWIGLVALLLALKIGSIYVNNFTLMVRPEVWAQMYRGDSLGTSLPSGDPTKLARFACFLLGALAVGGAGATLLALNRNLSEEAAAMLRGWGGRVAAAAALGMLGTGYWVMAAQPSAVQEGFAANGLLRGAALGWGATGVALALVLGLTGLQARSRSWVLPVVGAVVGFLNTALLVVVRDGIRDVTLMKAGYDVWDRVVVTNWSVVGIFLFLFVVMLGVMGWLISVVASAEGGKESYA